VGSIVLLPAIPNQCAPVLTSIQPTVSTKWFAPVFLVFEALLAEVTTFVLFAVRAEIVLNLHNVEYLLSYLSSRFEANIGGWVAVVYGQV
jgi:hypothetical protein